MNKVELPDFDDMVILAEKIGQQKTSLEVCKNDLKYLLGEITDKVTTESKYLDERGKPPSNAHIKDTFHYLGTNEKEKMELKRLRMQIAELEGEVRTRELLFEVYQDMIGVWRTQSADARGAFLE